MVDGGIVGHLPASVARGMGADIVIAVDVNSEGRPISPPTNVFTIMSQSLSIMGRSSVSYLYQDADIVIRPRVGDYSTDDLTKAADLIRLGQEAAEKTLPAIKKLLIKEKPSWLKRVFAKPADERRVTMLNR